MDVDRIAGTFKDEVVFMTGATGFMGKVFLERLLRLTEVRKIFVLIRLKRDKNPNERLLEILGNPLFNKLKTLVSLTDILAKVQPINGDCSNKNLSISPDDRSAITSQSTMFFHFAATVKFNEKFKRAIELNVRGTREMVKLAIESPHLKLFCQISTAFCHPKQKHLQEKYYEAAADPDEMIDIAEEFSVEEVEMKLSSYLCDHVPNTYVFTKGLSEAIVARAHEKHGLPVMILRPAVIVSMLRDPLPGWTDNLNHLTGIFLSIGMGVFRTMFLVNEGEINTFPVDYAISNIMSCTWWYLSERKSALYVVNLECERMKFPMMKEPLINAVRETHPFEHALWYPHIVSRKNQTLQAIEEFFSHKLLAMIVDGIMKLQGRKPIVLTAVENVSKAFGAINYFEQNQWKFEQKTIRAIAEGMNEIEKVNYGTEKVDMSEFVTVSILGLRRYFFHQDDASIGWSRRRIKIMYIADRCIKLALLGVLLYIIYTALLR